MTDAAPARRNAPKLLPPDPAGARAAAGKPANDSGVRTEEARAADPSTTPGGAAALDNITPLTFEETKVELGLLAVAYREGTMDRFEWCDAVHGTMAGYIAGTATRGASDAGADECE